MQNLIYESIITSSWCKHESSLDNIKMNNDSKWSSGKIVPQESITITFNLKYLSYVDNIKIIWENRASQYSVLVDSVLIAEIKDTKDVIDIKSNAKKIDIILIKENEYSIYYVEIMGKYEEKITISENLMECAMLTSNIQLDNLDNIKKCDFDNICDCQEEKKLDTIQIKASFDSLVSIESIFFNFQYKPLYMNIDDIKYEIKENEFKCEYKKITKNITFVFFKDESKLLCINYIKILGKRIPLDPLLKDKYSSLQTELKLEFEKHTMTLIKIKEDEEIEYENAKREYKRSIDTIHNNFSNKRQKLINDIQLIKEDNNECKVCFTKFSDSKKRVIHIPCGHAVICEPCFRKLPNPNICSICRKRIESTHYVFF